MKPVDEACNHFGHLSSAVHRRYKGADKGENKSPFGETQIALNDFRHLVYI